MSLIICYLIVSHVLVFLVGRATSENQTLDKHYPGYREWMEQNTGKDEL